MNYSPVIIPLLCMLVRISWAKVQIDYLEEWNVLKTPPTISGYDSGGTMASQMQIAFSRGFRGAAMFASIWYRCAPYGYSYYLAGCGKGANKVSNGVADARSYEKSELIDPLSYMAYQKVYHWIPVKDELVVPAIRKETMTFYERVGTPSRNIMLKYQNSFHIMPTANSSDPVCTVSQLTMSAFSNDGVGTAYCTYYGIFEALNYLHNNTLKKPILGKVPSKLEPVRLFNQSVFLTPANSGFMDEIGFYYMPSRCTDDSAPCRLHVFLHGCYESRSRIKSNFIKRSGILQVAELNNIVMLFPQSIPFPGNDPGCWDVFAATGDNYATKDGIQMGAIADMLSTVIGKSF